MSEPSKAVFLSYASQDAEAAKRIADALRTAGVEVWFDVEGGLEHGDEWDAKIRKQIKECVLFIPLISAITQAREEGYFRLEWDLAAERARTIASGVPFILPVLIDDTREPAALVPDRFRTVQWTRLPGGNIPLDVLQRFLKLWSHRTGLLKHQAARASAINPPEPVFPTTSRRSHWPWIGLGLAAVAVSVVVWKFGHGSRLIDESTAAARPAAAAPAPKSEARQLIAKAIALFRTLDPSREDFALAEEYCQRALKLDPDDGEVWAITSQLNSAFVYRGWDASPSRKEQTRTMAERAMRLAPASVEARLAQAGAWSTFNINRDEREKLLREVVRDDPTNQGALRFLAVTVLANPDGLAESLALNERSAALPGGDPLALFNNARYLQNAKRQAEAYEMLQRSIAQKPITSALVLKMGLEIQWKEDLHAAEQTLRQLPPSALQEDRANYLAGLLRYYQRNAAGALEIWQAFPRESYKDFIYEGPKGLLVGLAYDLDGREAAARIEWRTALPVLEKSIAAAPNNATLYLNHAFLLACLGEKAAATEALRTHEQLAGLKYSDEKPMDGSVARVYARLGRLDEIFAHPRGVSRGTLRVSPDYAALRADPRFAKWIESDPVNASTGKAAAATAPDDKSVAVLAFANLSSDKEQEYFSDGVSEELLNVLAKVPGLKVTARTSSFYFKGKETPIPEIAKQLGVAYVVEGSVRRSGDKVRITAQLIKAADGFHVWSDTFTRDLKDIFAVQDEIAGLIAQNLRAKMAVSGERTAVAPDIYALILQARHAAAVQTNDGARQAIAFYQQAVARDPKSADAWAEMALNYVQLARFGGLATPEGMREARLAARRALDIDPENLSGILAIAWVQRTNDRDWRGAIASFRRALAVAPENVAAMSDAAICFLNVGLVVEAESLAARAAERDPLNPRAQWSLGAIFLWSGRAEQAVESYRKAVALAPLGDEYHSHLARALAISGHIAEAKQESSREPNERYRLVAEATIHYLAGERAEGDRAVQTISDKFGDQMAGYLANICALAGRVDDAFQWLERGYEARDASIAWAKTNTSYEGIRRDPRWEVFLHKMGLADEQLK